MHAPSASLRELFVFPSSFQYTILCALLITAQPPITAWHNPIVTTVSLDPENGRPIAVNSTFESILGPFYKFSDWEFADAASEDVNPLAEPTEGSSDKETNRSRFRDAINKVRTHLSNDPLLVEEVTNRSEKAVAAVKVRNIEMLTLGTNEAGLPVRKYFDWTIGTIQLDDSVVDVCETKPSSAVILWGDLVNEEESTDR